MDLDNGVGLKMILTKENGERIKLKVTEFTIG
jgi:hypothetical protein